MAAQARTPLSLSLISSDNCPVATLIRIARVGATLNIGENTHFRISPGTFKRKTI